MTFKSALNDIFSRFASIDILIEPEESAVREAVNKLKATNPKYFDGVKKIVVEHGNPKSPYVGKSTSEDVIYISIDAIRDQLDMAGQKDNQQAFVNEILKTLGHEAAHIHNHMQPTETASEIEESILEQKFPTVQKTSALTRSAAEISDEQKKLIVLNRELRDIIDQRTMLNKNVDYLLKSKVSLSPERDQFFRAEKDRLDALVSGKREEIAAVESLVAQKAAARNVEHKQPETPSEMIKPETANSPSQEEHDKARYQALFQSAAGDLTGILTGLRSINQALAHAPAFFRPESGVSARVKSAAESLANALRKPFGKANSSDPKSSIWSTGTVEKMLSEITEALLSIQELVTSEQDFFYPLTNSGTEPDFYNSNIRQLVDSLLALVAKVTVSLGGEYTAILQRPDVSPQVLEKQEPATEKSKTRRQQGEGKKEKPHSSAERSLAQIHSDLVAEYTELKPKLEEVLSFSKTQKNLPEQQKLISEIATLKSRLAESRSLLDSTEQSAGIVGGQMTKGKPSAEVMSKIMALKQALVDLPGEIASKQAELRNSQLGAATADDIIKIIAPYNDIDALSNRIDSIQAKLDIFKEIDLLKAKLETTREALFAANKAAGIEKEEDRAAVSPGVLSEIDRLNNLVTVVIPLEISDKEALLSVTSKPHSVVRAPGLDVAKNNMRASLEAIKLPVASVLFSKIMPGLIGGSDLQNEARTIRTKMTELAKLEPDDAEIFKWKDRLFDIAQEAKQRQTPEMIEFLGKLGQGVAALVFDKTADKGSLSQKSMVPQMPADFLGDALLLKNYSKEDGNAKILRDLDSAISVNLRGIDLLNKELEKVDASMLSLKQNRDALDAEKYETEMERLKAKKAYLVRQPIFENFRKSINSAVSRLVTAVHSSAPAAEFSPSVTRERGPKVKEVFVPEKQESGPFDELRRDQAKWLSPTPEAIDIEDLKSLPPSEMAKMTKLFQDNAKELAAVRKRIKDAEGIAEDRLTKTRQRIMDDSSLSEDARLKMLEGALEESRSSDLSALKNREQAILTEAREAKEMLRDPAAYKAKVLNKEIVSLESDFNKQLEMADSHEARIFELEQELKQLENSISITSDQTLKIKLMSDKDDKMALLRRETTRRDNSKAEADKVEQRLSDLRKKTDNISSELAKVKPQKNEDLGKAREQLKLEIESDQKTLADLQAALDELGPDASSDRRTGLVKRIDELSAQIDEAQNRLRGIRVYVPDEKYKEGARTAKERYDAAVKAGLENKAQKYKVASEAEKRAIERRRAFIDPKNPNKQLPSAAMLRGGRAMAYAYTKAMQLNPPTGNREAEVRDALYRFHTVDNYVRILDDQYLREASEKAEKMSNNTEEQYRVRFELLQEKQKSPEYVSALKLLNDSLEAMDQAMVIKAPEGVSALESVVKSKGVGKEEGYGEGEPTVRAPKPNPFVGKKDPYMLFFRAQYDAEQALARYKLAEAAKKKLDAVSAKAREAAREMAQASGQSEEEISSSLNKEHKQLMDSILFEQNKQLEVFDNIIDKLSETGVGQGAVPSTYFDPSKVKEYLDELRSAQNKLVREKELLRRYVQVTEVPRVTSSTFDPDRFPKHLAIEFSDELPPMGTLGKQQEEGGGVYKSLRYILPHVLYGYKKPEKKRKGQPVKLEKDDSGGSMVTEVARQRYHPAPIRPGGKMEPGETPKFMTQKMEVIPRSKK